MKLNWKVRFKNPAWLMMFQVLTFLGLIGVLVDPTTAGIGDNERALQYIEPGVLPLKEDPNGKTTEE